ncbi:MAG TPA: hypothetical protein DEH78_06955 [Solibacterales bacterium]|nr:hypothetical protein [Bryobacterales bacterium]
MLSSRRSFLLTLASGSPARGGVEWQRPLPASTPFPKSPFARLRFTGRHREYTNADTWYPSWASDGNLYSPWTDGYILPGVAEYRAFDDRHPEYPCNSLDFMGRQAATAQAVIRGDDPLNLEVTNLPPRIEASPLPYGGRYPCGSLVVDGVWYYGTYTLKNGPDCGGVGWTEIGPFVGFRISRDFGKSWTETPHTPAHPLFPEDPAKAKTKFGSPHFVDFGRNMRHSPGGMAYLIAHGSSSPGACNSWIQGDQIYLARVQPTPAKINDLAAYEFFAGRDSRGRAAWVRDFSRSSPLLEWPGRFGCVTCTWHPGVRRYLMCITRGVRKGHHDTLILEAPTLAGEWRLFEYLEAFGPEAYFFNIPSKFIRGRESLWICYSANWSAKHIDGDPAGSRYALSLHEVRWGR